MRNLLLLFVIFLPMVGNNPPPITGRVVWDDGTPFHGVVRLGTYIPRYAFMLDLGWSPGDNTDEDGSFIMHANLNNNGYVLLISEGGDGEYADWYILWEDDGSFWDILFPGDDVGTVVIYADSPNHNINHNACSSTADGQLWVCGKR